MYELEPASGIKASRVIQLADDIARNMSALSARVATIPGRTVIGIELPNVKREAVVLHEMMASTGLCRSEGAIADHPWQEYCWRSGDCRSGSRCRICWSRAPPVRASRSGSTA
jgi:DNA segregation ATPase FtsK/SpoIIIE-like protein